MKSFTFTLTLLSLLTTSILATPISKFHRLSSQSDIKVIKCPFNSIATTLNDVVECTSCTIGTATCSSAENGVDRSTSSVKCNHSFYLQASTSTSIMTCAPCAVGAGSGYLNQVTSCSPCREGALSCVTSPKARDLSCDTNLFLNKAHRCTACAPGTGTAYDNDDRRCRRCPMGATKCLFEVTAIDCLPGFNLIAASSGLSVCSLDSNTASVISVQ